MANAFIAIAFAYATAGGRTGTSQRKDRCVCTQFNVEYTSGEAGMERKIVRQRFKIFGFVTTYEKNFISIFIYLSLFCAK